jgi:DNA-binding LytR/AlgR family response regulator
MNILIVEDEELAVKKLQKTLQALGEDIDIVGTLTVLLLPSCGFNPTLHRN